jgi:Lsr2
MSRQIICHTLTPDSQAKESTMAQRVVTTFEDDLTGGEAEGTVRFSLDGADWEIDLNAENAAALRKAFGPYVEHARKASGSQPARRTRSSAARRDTTVIRSWARANNVTVNDRGRIPAEVVAQYEASNA